MTKVLQIRIVSGSRIPWSNPIKTISENLDLSDRRERQLVTDGILPYKSERGRYELIEHMTSRYNKRRKAKDAKN